MGSCTITDQGEEDCRSKSCQCYAEDTPVGGGDCCPYLTHLPTCVAEMVMDREPTIYRSSQTMNPSSGSRVSMSQRQRALLGQWQALGYLMLFFGLFLGMVMTWGTDGPMLVNVGLVAGTVVFAPLGLMIVSAWLDRCRLASVLGMLSALFYVSLLPLLVWSFAGPLQLLSLLGFYMPLLGLLVNVAVATFGSASVLWGAGDRRCLQTTGLQSTAIKHPGKDRRTLFQQR